jgi:hypothetical protein
MTSGTVVFGELPFALYDLKFEPTQPEQLDIPMRTDEGTIEFDSEFDIWYRAQVSYGLGPVHEVSGPGRAHMVGKAPAVNFFELQVFETELLQLDLYALTPVPEIREIYFRESPTLESKGLTIREDLCPPCAGPVTYWRVFSYSEVFGEFSPDGGKTWVPGDRPLRVEQAPAAGIPGDLNRDGTVDAVDYVFWRDAVGEASVFPDSRYTLTDYLVWKANFGATIGGSGSGQTFAAVPEPAAFALIAIYSMPILAAGRRKSAR